MRLVFKEDENQNLILYNVRPDGSREYARGPRAYDTVYNIINENEFTVEACGPDIRLKGDSYTVTFKRYRDVVRHPEMRDFEELIYYTMQKKGVVRINPNKNLSHTHTHKSKHARNKLKMGTIVVAAGIILVVGIVLGNHKKTPEPVIIIDTPAQVQQVENYNDNADDFNFVYSDEVPSEYEEVVVEEREPDAYFEYEHLCDTEKAINCKDMYFDLISKYSRLYGIDENMMLALATQERGVHSREIDGGGGVGLMQMQYNVWVGEDIDGYKLNEETGKYEYVKYRVTDENIRDLETNIEFSCIAMQQCLRRTGYNNPMSLQMYNMGYGSIHEGLVNYCSDTGQIRADVCMNPSDLGWLDYCKDFAGDPNYIPNVLRWAENTEFTNFNIETNENVTFKFGSSLDLGRR